MEEQIKTPAKRGPKPKAVEPVIEEAVVADVEQHEAPVEHVVPRVKEVKAPEKPVDRKHVWYTVRQGDSLEYIASRFHRTEAEIARVNNIPLDGRLISGITLKIYLD